MDEVSGTHKVGKAEERADQGGGVLAPADAPDGRDQAGPDHLQEQGGVCLVEPLVLGVIFGKKT
jgi:hypothetical protein